MKHEIKVPEVGESISEVVIAEWLKNNGDFVERDEPICEIESDKASFEVPSDESGVLEQKVEEGETVSVGALLAVIDTETEQPEKGESEAAEKKEQTRAEKAEPKEEKATEKTPKVEVRISPVASNMLKEAGIASETVQGTGVEGKITKSDAQKAIKEKQTEEPKEGVEKEKEPSKAPEKERQKQVISGDREVEKSKMSTLRKTVAERLVRAKNETAMLTTFNEIDMSAVIEVRKRYKDMFQDKFDVRLGFMSFFTKACCVAFQEFPTVNSKLEDNNIVYHKYADIGVAVSTERGLVVPVLRNADQLSFAEMEEGIYDLAIRARDNKLSIEEMRGGTFTITNGGVFGSLLSTPIINSPQSAILGMHKIEERPVAIDGEVQIRPMMYVALSYDHRIIDGKDSVQFLVRLKELLEDPSRMLLQI